MVKTIRARLTLWYILLLALILVGFSGALYVTLARGLYQQVDDYLARHAHDLGEGLRVKMVRLLIRAARTTSLTMMRGAIDVALQRPRERAEFARVLNELGADVEQLPRMAEDLLMLARADYARRPHRFSAPVLGRRAKDAAHTL